MSPVSRWTIRLLAVALLAVEIFAAATGQREVMYAAVLVIAALTAVVWAMPSKDER